MAQTSSNTTDSDNLQAVHDKCRDFPEAFQSLLIASCNASGLPEASYAAYIDEAGDYYVYLSELAAHTQNLQENPRCSVLFIEDEQAADHLFARQRLVYQCDVAEVSRQTPRFEEIMDLFEAKFGGFMKMMRKLEDFHLFRLVRVKGKFVAGFAQAYEISGNTLDEVKHRNEKGHRGGRVQAPESPAEPRQQAANG